MLKCLFIFYFFLCFTKLFACDFFIHLDGFWNLFFIFYFFLHHSFFSLSLFGSLTLKPFFYPHFKNALCFFSALCRRCISLSLPNATPMNYLPVDNRLYTIETVKIISVSNCERKNEYLDANKTGEMQQRKTDIIHK